MYTVTPLFYVLFIDNTSHTHTYTSILCLAWLTGFLDILGGAYAACALFNIGIFMVGKLKKLTGTVILTATLLIVAKTYIILI